MRWKSLAKREVFLGHIVLCPKKTSARTSAAEKFSETNLHSLFKCLTYKLRICNQMILSSRQKFCHRITAHRNCNTCIWTERRWITRPWHWRSKSWSQSSCCIENRDNLMCFLGLVSAFNIYVLFLFSQHHYQFSCWQAFWQEAQALWYEWALTLLLVSSGVAASSIPLCC